MHTLTLKSLDISDNDIISVPLFKTVYVTYICFPFLFDFKLNFRHEP